MAKLAGKARVLLRRVCALSAPGAHWLAFLPALVLAAYWLGGEGALIAAALAFPAIALVAARTRGDGATKGTAQACESISMPALAARADDLVARAMSGDSAAACFLIQIDGISRIADVAGQAEADTVRQLLAARLRAHLRDGDLVLRTGDARFAILLGARTGLSPEALMQLAARLQAVCEEPAPVNGGMSYFSACVGVSATPVMKGPIGGQRLVEAARVALQEAENRGPSAIRAWSVAMGRAHAEARMLRSEVHAALSNGQIQPYYQPQICTSTGQVTGVEALARWIHPEHGVVPPARFLKSLEEAGQMSQLATTVLHHGLTALRTWDAAGVCVPRVSVNFSSTELRGPHLVDQIKWELDRFGVPPHRLGIEVLETVVTTAPDAAVARTIRALRSLGCFVELDDFGTGHASLTALSSLQVDRLKIDRSYVRRIDRDENQRRMIAAVLSFAERLDIDTLAEGVETVGEHALLAQLGCAHVQGFGIARPMPVDRIVPWIATHTQRIREAEMLSHRASRRD